AIVQKNNANVIYIIIKHKEEFKMNNDNKYSSHNHSGHSGHDHSGHSGHNHRGHSGHNHSGHSGHNHSVHSRHAQHQHGCIQELFLKSLPLGIIIMFFSPLHGFKLPFQFTFPYSDIVVAILSTILIIYGGRPFYQGAVDEFKQKKPGMMALVSLGISVSYLYSIY